MTNYIRFHVLDDGTKIRYDQRDGKGSVSYNADGSAVLKGWKNASIFGNEANNNYTVVDSTGVKVYGKGGDDKITLVNSTHSKVFAGGGNDQLKTIGGYNNQVKGHSGNDSIFNRSNFTYMNGSSGNDYINSMGHANIIKGGSQQDSIFALGHYNQISGGCGDDFISTIGQNNVSGDCGTDYIIQNGIYTGDNPYQAYANPNYQPTQRPPFQWSLPQTWFNPMMNFFGW